MASAATCRSNCVRWPTTPTSSPDCRRAATARPTSARSSAATCCACGARSRPPPRAERLAEGQRKSPASAGLFHGQRVGAYSLVPVFFTATFLAGALATVLVAFLATGAAAVPAALVTALLLRAL